MRCYPLAIEWTQTVGNQQIFINFQKAVQLGGNIGSNGITNQRVILTHSGLLAIGLFLQSIRVLSVNNSMPTANNTADLSVSTRIAKYGYPLNFHGWGPFYQMRLNQTGTGRIFLNCSYYV